MKFLVRWNAGYGDVYDEVDVNDQEQAEDAAYEFWREDVEAQADYEAVPMTAELADEHGFNFDDD